MTDITEQAAYKEVRDLVYRMAPNGEADAALMLAINNLVASVKGSVTEEIEELPCAGCKRITDIGLLMCPTCLDEHHNSAPMSLAIEKVKRLRDGWAENLKFAMVAAANEIITALEAVQSKTPSAVQGKVEELVDEVLYQMLGEFPNCVNGWATNELPTRIASALQGKAGVSEREPINVQEQHDFVLLVGSNRCGLRGCTLGVLEHAWIPSWDQCVAATTPASVEAPQVNPDERD